MNVPPRINDRYIEDPVETPLEKARAEQGRMIIKDTATGKALIVCAITRAGALFVLRALNAADRSELRLAEEDAA
jgi:hypothetical protein